MKAIEDKKVKKLAIVVERKKIEDKKRYREFCTIEENKERYSDKFGSIKSIS
jgi:hypothetical protein